MVAIKKVYRRFLGLCHKRAQGVWLVNTKKVYRRALQWLVITKKVYRRVLQGVKVLVSRIRDKN